MAKRKIKVAKLDGQWCILMPSYGFTNAWGSVITGFHSQRAAFTLAYRFAGTGSTSTTTQTNVTRPMDMHTHERMDWV